VPRYLAEFQWRFNRRARLADMLDQLDQRCSEFGLEPVGEDDQLGHRSA
jgi:hypothetical protein